MTPLIPGSNIACNSLPCFFACSGLLPQIPKKNSRLRQNLEINLNPVHRNPPQIESEGFDGFSSEPLVTYFFTRSPWGSAIDRFRGPMR